jgi:hypothetical protein
MEPKLTLLMLKPLSSMYGPDVLPAALGSAEALGT